MKVTFFGVLVIVAGVILALLVLNALGNDGKPPLQSENTGAQ